MKRSEIASFFDVSRQAVSDWQRRGCPVDSDIGSIAEWKASREMRLAGIEPGTSRFPKLIGEHAWRMTDLNRRISGVNVRQGEGGGDSDLLRATIRLVHLLEMAILSVPQRILNEGPDKAPDSFFTAVFSALDEVKDDSPTPPLPAPGKRRAVGPVKATGGAGRARRKKKPRPRPVRRSKP